MQFFQVIAAFSLLAPALAQNGYVESCPMIQLIDDHNLQARSHGPSGLEMTVLDLNQCVANINGELVAQDGYVASGFPITNFLNFIY
jgi:hypothetical protein